MLLQGTGLPQRHGEVQRQVVRGQSQRVTIEVERAFGIPLAGEKNRRLLIALGETVKVSGRRIARDLLVQALECGPVNRIAPDDLRFACGRVVARRGRQRQVALGLRPGLASLRRWRGGRGPRAFDVVHNRSRNSNFATLMRNEDLLGVLAENLADNLFAAFQIDDLGENLGRAEGPTSQAQQHSEHEEPAICTSGVLMWRVRADSRVLRESVLAL